MLHDPHAFLQIALHAAIAAGAILKDKRQDRHQLSYKGETDLVTEMDHQAEDLIVEIISNAFSGHSLLTEERGSIDRGSDEYLWVIDPLDGTTNYAHGFPWYAVSIALLHHDQTLLGVVYHPEMNELFHAVRGIGAWLNNQRISTSPQTDLAKSLLSTGFPYNINSKKKPENNLDFFMNMIGQCQGIRRAGAAAIDLCYVACGRFDGFWELGLKPWDSAAATLMITEAGGRVTNLDGTDHSPFDHSLVASNTLIHQDLLACLQRTIRNSIRPA
ncbi:inositol monophosphatase [bacterium]|nr:inositol monophosphatase [bacterium]